MTTVPQIGGSNESKYYPLGRGLGGSGAINGMFWCRGDEAEYNAWAGTLRDWVASSIG
jgi:choline dehydrogenase-like flavoprotein